MQAYLEKLRAKGFRVVVIVMGHHYGRHWAVIGKVSAALEKESGGGFQVVARTDPEWTSSRYPGDHAGANETSY